MRDQSLFVNTPTEGGMYFAYYDPIHKDSLPYYDEFPILLPWDFWKKDGHIYMISINLHFLPPSLRYQAMKHILTLRTEKRYRKNTKLKMEWSLLKAMSNSKIFEHSVRIYRMDRFRSKFIKIPPQSWELAIYLPLGRISKGGGKSKGSPYTM